MKKQSILSVNILFILSIICFLYVTSCNKSTKSTTYPWAESRKDALISLELEDLRLNSPKKFTISKENGVLRVSKPIFYKISPNRIAIFATTFMNLKPKNIFTNVSPEEYNAYGLNTPQIRLHSKIKGLPDSTLILGTSTTLGGDVYTALESNKNTVYLLSNEEASIILGGLSSLLNNTPFDTEYDDETHVMFRNLMDESWHFVKTNSFWVQLPTMETNRDWGMRRFLQQAKDFRFETNNISYDISPNELSNIGIDMNTSPYFKVSGNNSSYSIYVGNEQDGVYQVYIPEMQASVMVGSAFINQIFRLSMEDLAPTKRS